MAKKMRKMLALLLALAILGGQMSLPILATEVQESEEIHLASVSDEAVSEEAQATITTPESTTTPAPSTTTSTYTDPGTGAEVTQTNTVSTNPDTGAVTESTTTQSVTQSPDGTQMTSQTTWENTTTETGSDTQGTNPVTTTETNVVTKVEGTETINQSDSMNTETGIETISGDLTGQETTEVTGTTITTTTETGVITGETTLTEEGQVEDLENSTSTTDNDFVSGTEKEEEWEDGSIEKGRISGISNKNETATITPEHEGNVTLELKPDEKLVTKSYEIGLDDLASVPQGATTTPIVRNGKTVGWTVTYQQKVVTSENASDTNVTEGSWNPVGRETTTYVNPGNYTVGTTTEGDDLQQVANGESVTTKIEEIYEDGVYQGYRIITTTTTKVTGEEIDEEVGKRTDASYEKVEGDVLDAGYTMPEEPQASTTTDEEGNVTTVSYVLIEEDGQPKGYAITTEQRSPEGKLIRTETRNVYGTSHTSQTTVETDPTAERTTTTTLKTKTEVQEIRTTETTREMEKVDNRVQTYETTIISETDTYELIRTDAGTFFLYQGKMYRVEAIGSHGEADVDTLTPDSKYITASQGSDLRNKNGTSTGLFSDYNDADNDVFPDGYEFRYVGNGAASTLRVRYENGGSTTAHQFALRDSDGNLHYVYCCDLNTSAVKGTYYEIENLKDAGYYSTAEGSDTIDHIRTIATNGFWATSGDANDTGTLASVKALLKKYDKYFDADLTAVANSLTEGEALSATQAALWAFGNRGTKPSETDIVSATKTNGYSSNAIDERNVMALYELLTSDILKNATKDTSTDLIDKQDITGSTVTIYGEAVYDDGSVKTVNGSTVYNTDVSFQLNVEKSSITGNLVVKVVQDGKVIRTEQIATDDSNFVGKILAGNESDGSTSYTIEGLELIEGIKFSLNLEGTQDMEEGVYLYTAKGGNSASQTFVGVAAGERDVNLAVELEFQVSDPKVKHTNSVTTAIRKDTQEGTRVSSRTDKKVNTETRTSGNIWTHVFHDIDIVSTVTTTETKQEITKSDRNWKSSWEYMLKVIDDLDGNPDEDPEDGYDGGYGGEEETGSKRTRILDEEVPLAAAPRTGDLSGLWVVISGLSVGGMALLSVKRKEEE